MFTRFLCAMLVMAFAVFGQADAGFGLGIGFNAFGGFNNFNSFGIGFGRARIVTPFVPSVQVFAQPQIIQQAVPVQQFQQQAVMQVQQVQPAVMQVQQVQQQSFAVQPQVFQSAAVFGSSAFLTPSFGFGTAFIGGGGFRQVGVGRAFVGNRGAAVVRQRTVVRKR